MIRILILMALWFGGAVSAAAQVQTRDEPIMYGFVPDVAGLELMTGDELKARLRGKTVAGIYGLTMHDDQRYTETFNADGTMNYRERDFTSSGRWFTKGNKLCFAYTERRGAPFCFYEFKYGSCVVTYSDGRALVAGKPAAVERWSAVQVVVEDDFAWPANPSKDDALTCQFPMV